MIKENFCWLSSRAKSQSHCMQLTIKSPPLIPNPDSIPGVHMTLVCVSPLFFSFLFYFFLTPVLVCSNCCNLVCRKSLSNYYYAHGKEGMGLVDATLSTNVKSYMESF